VALLLALTPTRTAASQATYISAGRPVVHNLDEVPEGLIILTPQTVLFHLSINGKFSMKTIISNPEHRASSSGIVTAFPYKIKLNDFLNNKIKETSKGMKNRLHVEIIEKIPALQML
jgi:hypothetical protein